MVLRRTSHAVYETNYHPAWCPKYGKWILRGDVRESVKAILNSLQSSDDTFEITKARVHLFMSFPPRYSISEVVGKLKSISARVIFKRNPDVEKISGVVNFGKMDFLPSRLAIK
jgi:putative transposase